MMETTASKLSGSKSNKWVKGQSGNPAGRKQGVVNKSTLLRQKFTESRAQDVLECVFGAAYNDPTTARWLAARLFGEGRWSASIAPTSVTTVDECKTAMDNMLNAFFAGSISEDEMHAVNEALVQRLVRLEIAEKSASPNG